MRFETLPAPVPAENVCATYSLAHCDGVVILSAQGEASNRRECHGIYRILNEALMLTLEKIRPSSLIFDFRELDYTWGDNMAKLLGSWDLPTAVVTSPQNYGALSTLISEELFGNPEEFLFSSLDAAIAAVQSHRDSHGAT